jgi:hypothetical protein
MISYFLKTKLIKKMNILIQLDKIKDVNKIIVKIKLLQIIS